MKAVEGGYIKKPGLSKAEAAEYTKSNVGSKKYSKLVDAVKPKKKKKKS
jgi:hypothetical protein